MALLTCEDCGHEVSDRAPACPKCGAPVDVATGKTAPSKVTLDGELFVGTRALIKQLAIKAIHSLNYKVDSASETTGLVCFTTGMTWGSWTGVSGSLVAEEVGKHTFTVTGAGKQNVRGGQVLAFNLFDEANGKVRNVRNEMKRLASS